jgi:hypothetical protein
VSSAVLQFDHYRASGNKTWLDAATGAWELLHGDFEHVDGTSSLTEGAPATDPVTGHATDWKAKSYRLLLLAAAAHTRYPIHSPASTFVLSHSFCHIRVVPRRIFPGTNTGETCCSTFWVKLNQRFHLLHPSDERYSAEVRSCCTVYC